MTTSSHFATFAVPITNQTPNDLPSGSYQSVGTGEVEISLTVESGAFLTVSGGTTDGTVLNGGGYETVSASGVSNGTTVESGGYEIVSVGGQANAAAVQSGGFEEVQGGATEGSLIDAGGSEEVSSGSADSTLLNGGALTVYGGTVTATQIGSGGVLATDGGAVSGTAVDAGGRLEMYGGTASGATVAAGGVLEMFGGTVSGATVDAGGVLETFGDVIAGVTLLSGGVEEVESGSPTGTDMEFGATIEVHGIFLPPGTRASVDPSTDLLSVIAGGTTLYSQQLVGNYAGWIFNVANGAITVIAACFCRGTRIRTDRGDVPVEALSVGDRAVTRSGRLRPIVWIGGRTETDCRQPGREATQPIRIMPDAFGHGTPSRALFLSAEHAIYAEGALIPIAALIDGTTIQPVAIDTVEYFHVELDAHDVLFAEGLPVESYLDNLNRDTFDWQMWVDDAARCDRQHALPTPCAPIERQGPRVAEVRRRIQARRPAVSLA